MTDLPLSTYIKAARESAGGVIRESSEDRTKLVNKGTLGHWIATKLDWGDSGTRGDRNERAVEGFRQALVDRYGSTIAEEALKAAGLDGDIETLTGKGVLQAAKHAQKAVKENRSVNDEVFLRRRDEGESQLDSALQKLVFRQSYRQEFAGQTQYGRVKVGEVPDELGQKIVDRIKKMDDSALTRSLDLRRELGDAMVSLLQTVSQHRRTMPLLEGMARIGDLLRDLAEVEQVPPEEVEPWCRAMQDYIMHAAVSTIGRQKVGLLEGLQLKLLSDDAPLRAVYAEARALSEEGTDAETALAQQVMELCESMVDGLSRRLGPRSGLAKLDLERLRDGDTVGDGPRTGVKAWLKARSEEKTVGEVPKDPPVKVEQVKVEQVDRKAGDEQALLRARDQWIELIGKVQPEPTEPEEPSPFDDNSSDMTTVDGGDDTGKDYAQLMDDWRWAVTLRERTLKATLDKPVLQYMLDTGCSLSKAVDVFHDLLIQDEALRQMVGFIDQQLLIDGMVEIEETGILREGPRRIEYASIPERRQQFELERARRLKEQPDLQSPPSFDPNVGYQFFSDLAGEIRGIGGDQNERSWDEDSIALQRAVARRVSELAVRMDVDVDTLCNGLRSILGEAQLLPAARRAIEDGLDLVQYPTPGSRLVDDLVSGFPIRDGQEGGWSLEDMRSVIDHHVGWLVEKGEMSRGMICEDLAATIRTERFRHDLHPQAISDILNLLSTLQ